MQSFWLILWEPWITRSVNGSSIGDFPATPQSNLGYNPNSPESVSYQDPGSVPSVNAEYMGGGAPSSVPEDLMDLVESLDFDISASNLNDFLHPDSFPKQ